MRSAPCLTLAAAVALLGMTGCGAENAREESGGSPGGPPEEVVLGPVDGHELPGTDLERVRVGDPAPDFSLTSYAGPVVTLSDFRGAKNVVLVFYRGHW